MSASPAALHAEGVVKRFRDHRACDGIDLSVGSGDVYGLLGPNGAGKTTFIRMVLDILRPDEGKVAVLGDPPGPAVRDRIGYLPEERGLDPRQRVWEILAYLGRLKGLAGAEAKARAFAWLERLGLAEHARKRVRELSRGMNQKVQFAATILHEPDLLILDEPFTGLDPVNKKVVLDLILEQVSERGATVILSTHLLEQAEALCSRVGLLHRGRIVLEGDVASIRRAAYDGSHLVAFDGEWTPPTSWGPATISARAGRRFHRVRPPEGVGLGDEIARAIEAGHRPVHIEEDLPTLEEVFIRTVGSSVAEVEDRDAREVA